MTPEEARIRKLEERNTDLTSAIEEARDKLGMAIAFADPYSPEDVKVSKSALRDAEKILRPFDLREHKTAEEIRDELSKNDTLGDTDE